MDALVNGGASVAYAGGKMLAAKEDGIGLITFNQPEKRNAMSVEMWVGLGEILDEFAEDSTVRVVILTGAGHKAFVSGADICSVRQAALERRRTAGIRPDDRRWPEEVPIVPQADDRPHSRLLPGRRIGIGDADRPTHRLGGQRVRHPGGAAVDRLCVRRSAQPGEPGGTGACTHDPLHRHPHRCGGSANESG